LTRIPTITACLLLAGCNPPSMWQYHPATAFPPVYAAPAKKACHDKWGRQITRQDFHERDYQFAYGDHCYLVGGDPRPISRNRDRRAFR